MRPTSHAVGQFFCRTCDRYSFLVRTGGRLPPPCFSVVCLPLTIIRRFRVEPLLDTNCVAFEGEVRADCPVRMHDVQARQLAAQMSELWSSFARDGVPTLRRQPPQQQREVPAWEQWNFETQSVLHLATTREGGLHHQHGEKQHECEFWDAWESLVGT